MSDSEAISFTMTPLPWQLATWQQLHGRMRDGRLPHALLLYGVPGTGKLLLARNFARLALCRAPQDGLACGTCPACTQFAAGSHPDFHFVGIPEDKTIISVAQLRELINALGLTSQHGGRRVAIIEPADAMNTAAANALLKTLEEPGADTLLLLVTSRPARLPATIRSRCQLVRMLPPARESAVAWLGSQAPRPDWPVLLGVAGGGPLAALQLADSPQAGKRLDMYQTLAEVRAGQRNPLTFAKEWSAKDADFVLTLRLFQCWVMDLIMLKSGTEAGIVNRDALPLLQTTAQGLHLRGLHGLLNRLNDAVAVAATSVNRQLLLESLLVDWADSLKTVAAAPLAARGG